MPFPMSAPISETSVPELRLTHIIWIHFTIATLGMHIFYVSVVLESSVVYQWGVVSVVNDQECNWGVVLIYKEGSV